MLLVLLRRISQVGPLVFPRPDEIARRRRLLCDVEHEHSPDRKNEGHQYPCNSADEHVPCQTRIELHLRVSEGVGDAQRTSHQSRYPDKTRLISVMGQNDHRCVCKKHRGAYENRAPTKRAPASSSEPRLSWPEPPVETRIPQPPCQNSGVWITPVAAGRRTLALG